MSEPELAGVERMRQFVASSQLSNKLAIEVAELGGDFAHLRLPFDPTLTTVGRTVHGGAIATLADVAATAACWTAADLDAVRGGATLSLTIDFMEPANYTALEARASVLRRGGTTCFAEVSITDESGQRVAHALVTYRFARAR